MGKKIVWQSNSPLVGSGYGNQTYLFTKLLSEDDWEVTVAANYGLSGNLIEFDGITVLPQGLDSSGGDVIRPHYERFKPDIYFMLYDIWPFNADVWKGVPLTAWIPVDHEPAPPAVVERALEVPFPVAMSKYGESALRDHAVDPFYIPHGVATNIFEPGDRKKSRGKFKLPARDTFFVVMNAANKGVPSRKGFEAVLKAWSLFIRKYPNALLYIHGMPLPVHHGYDLIKLAEFYRLTNEHVRFPSVYDYAMGNYKWDFLVDMYNAADVLLAPSMGEGFGIPVVEAHACGCPTIVSDFTAQSELGSHYRIPIDPIDDKIVTAQLAEQAVPRPSEILAALEYYYHHRTETDIREEARVAGERYDALRVYQDYMLPVFETIMKMTS